MKHRGRLRELAGTYDLADDAVFALDVLLGLFADDPTAPTTVTNPADGIDVHIADSLAALAIPAVHGAQRIADLGSGAGVPGLVLAAALPQARTSLVETVGKKCAFIERAGAAMGLANVTVVHARAEEWPAGIAAHDLITARAVDSLSVVCEYAAPLLAPGGTLVAWKGARSADEEVDGAAAARELGLSCGEVIAVRPYPASRDRHLHLYSKVAPTPDRFPRRAGMARKRPIHASGRP